MEKIEKITIKLLMLLIGFSLLFPVRALAAEKDEITEKKQIIFLLDASKSMQGDGQWIEAADSACMIASALPKEYEVALLVYNTEIVYEEDFGNINQKTRHALETVELQGYTTPAVALETAADMFDSAAADKRVVFISDGEISLRDQSKTETAIRQFENMVDQIAEKGIKIDMFAIPNDKTENEVSYGTKVTSGEQYTVGENQTIEEITAKYLFQTLQMEKILWAHEEAYKRGITNPVSSSELFIELGEKVHLFLGERFNIKVTTPEDLTTLRSQFYYENYKQFAKEELKYGL